QYFKRKYSIENEEKGRDIFLKELSRLHLNRNVITDPELLKRISDKLISVHEIFAAIGCRIVAPGWLINRLKQESAIYKNEVREKALEGTLSVSLEGKSDVLVTRAGCCDPLPGESVEAYETKEKGYVIHSRRCPNMVRYRKDNPDRVHPVTWQATDKLLPCNILIKTQKRIGLFRDVSSVIADQQMLIINLSLSQPAEAVADIHVTLGIRDIDSLKALFRDLGKVSGVISVTRITKLRSKELR
ncbi:MAG: bifunctional (p)ppGpp synthetase/guanosine-3',5'-bis(diphosphate) 3'-pyrophosphohydrolase, partial [Abditibacteriota bacterium]|nr:bifunctional (p)ppGpp synthetase/guanosine-3',5'-bis(diphosphate) 3'-pyrophosphohydrolase [Abditibacteriota bacterium]